MSYINYFEVPKTDDIRVVYNGTSCGLNPTMWAPKFWLPTPKSAAGVINYDYCGVDLDIGEMFLNFPLPILFHCFSGIDLSPLKDPLGFESLKTMLDGLQAQPLLLNTILLLGRGICSWESKRKNISPLVG
jgi:hypothetical protein